MLGALRRSGPMIFARYMTLCLYHPEHGYYMQGRERTGVGGDYFTSADLHPIFARLIARQAAEMWEILGKPARFTWVEMGAGRGWFARDFLAWVAAARPDFMAALDYLAVEPGPRQRDRLLERLAGEAVATVDDGQRVSKVRVLGGLEELEPVTGCFFSNELVDAFPVSVVTRSGGRLKEIYVTAEGERLRERHGPISDSRVAAAVARYANQLEEGQRAEVSLEAVQWIRAVAERLARGFVVTIDYGDLAERLYTVDRSRGTLMAYREHKASENFFDAPGEQDLTAHVNFSALIDAGRDAGLDCAGLTTQERFLMALGEPTEFADLYDEGQTEAERLQARLKLKRLLDPGSMGNIFKVLVQHKGVAAPQLTGLKYYRR
ncbi:MAG: SAM-dependent methyltransferase [Acidobacteria bacterium]|nr:MAG: SAM-dependent methyltransferase [Acidobacteriota bacterium]